MERGPNGAFFVSGIDTGIGKTIATGLMAKYLASKGIDAITVKMVQTGCDGFSEDLELHRKMCGGVRFPEDELGLTAPQIFRFPSSPRLAARLEGREVDLDAVSSAVERCAAAHGVALVEGAGGLLVPLSGGVTAADFAARRRWPLVLVTCGRLGSVNHTLLSLEAAAARSMRVAGVVFNWHPEADSTIEEDAVAETAEALRRLGRPAAIVRVPRVADPADAPLVDFGPVFGLE